MTVVLNLKKFSQFINILRINVQSRLFEDGRLLRFSICSDFDSVFPSSFHSNIMQWNDHPVIQPLACATGIYIQSLGRFLNPNDVGQIIHPVLVDELKNSSLPSSNYLSWVLFGASNDTLLISFVKKRDPTVYY